MYKRRSKSSTASDKSTKPDEEKGPQDDRSVVGSNSERVEKALEASPTRSDIFSWQDLNYVVPIGKGETRQLLDNVSGYVVPGKLTALMGESGAGKVGLSDNFIVLNVN